MGFNIFSKLKKGLSKTRDNFKSKINSIFSSKKEKAEMLEDLEEFLISSDIGVKTSLELVKRLSQKNLKDEETSKETLKEEIKKLLEIKEEEKKDIKKPHIVMFVGVNGTGKTTNLGKLAYKFSKKKEDILIIAADTFRAAAVEQLEIWAERAKCSIIKQKENSDPASVCFDGVDSAISKNKDIVLIDTAGRLHNKKNLMEELKKINRTIEKKCGRTPDEILLTIDATTGQNGLEQARFFNEAIGVTGIVLTKLDGTAKGGIVINISNSLNIPIKYIGVGEGIEDLQDFESENFVNALFE